MRKIGVILVALVAIGLTPPAPERKPCNWNATILALAHAQARIVNRTTENDHALIDAAKAALDSTNCFPE